MRLKSLLFAFLILSINSYGQSGISVRAAANIVTTDATITSKLPGCDCVGPVQVGSPIDSCNVLIQALDARIGSATGLQGTLNAGNIATQVAGGTAQINLQDNLGGAGYNVALSPSFFTMSYGGAGGISIFPSNVTNSQIRWIDNASSHYSFIAAGSLHKNWSLSTPDTGGVIPVENGRDKLTVNGVGSFGALDYNGVGVYSGSFAKVALFVAAGVGEVGIEDATNPHHYNQLYAYKGLTGVSNTNYLPSTAHNGDTLATIGDLSNVPLDSVLKAGNISSRAIGIFSFLNHSSTPDFQSVIDTTKFQSFKRVSNQMWQSNFLSTGIAHTYLNIGTTTNITQNIKFAADTITVGCTGLGCAFDVYIPAKGGTVAFTSDIPSVSNVAQVDTMGLTSGATIRTYTTPAANATYIIGAYLNPTAVAGNVSINVVFTDENSTTQTIQIISASTTGYGNGRMQPIRVKASSLISITTIVSVSATYDAGATIKFDH